MDWLEYLINAFENVAPEDESIGEVIDHLPHPFKTASGESRYAVWVEQWDFVIKIPRYGYAEKNYCALEVHNYERAKAYGVERICLPIEKHCETNSGISLYKQTRYSLSTYDAFSRNVRYDKYLNKRNSPIASRGTMAYRVQQGCYEGYRLDERWIGRVLQLYGKKFCRSFEKWTQECEINDLHNSNTGWLNNKPILLDYAGYHG